MLLFHEHLVCFPVHVMLVILYSAVIYCCINPVLLFSPLSVKMKFMFWTDWFMPSLLVGYQCSIKPTINNSVASVLLAACCCVSMCCAVICWHTWKFFIIFIFWLWIGRRNEWWWWIAMKPQKIASYSMLILWPTNSSCAIFIVCFPLSRQAKWTATETDFLFSVGRDQNWAKRRSEYWITFDRCSET